MRIYLRALLCLWFAFLQLNEEEEQVEREKKNKLEVEEKKREVARLKKRQVGLNTYKVCVAILSF